MHGGDIYGNRVRIDFSVNVNPLGTPKEVTAALHSAVNTIAAYPDPEARQLKEAVSRMLSVPKEHVIFGNGASELFMALVHAIRPEKTLIPVPSFYGYEHAARASGRYIAYYMLNQQTGYLPQDDFLEALGDDIDLLFIANPNNPTGQLMSKEYLKRLLDICRQKKIIVVLDECFIEFCGAEYSMMTEIGAYDNLLIVRAFTKIFAIPGVRLGYLTGSDTSLLERIKRQLPEWNVSVFAQAAGSACADMGDYIRKTAAYVQKERQFLEEHLMRIGLKVFSGRANFILVYSEKDLYEKLLKYGILIRDCENFRGLSKGFYRIAVKDRHDNKELLKALRGSI